MPTRRAGSAGGSQSAYNITLHNRRYRVLRCRVACASLSRKGVQPSLGAAAATAAAAQSLLELTLPADGLFSLSTPLTHIPLSTSVRARAKRIAHKLIDVWAGLPKMLLHHIA